MIADIVVLVVLILLNGFFSLSEMAVVSANRQRLQAEAAKRLATDERASGHELALALNREPARFLSAVQIGITLIGVMAGAFGGATLSAPLAETLASVPYVHVYATEVAFAVVVILITFASLIVGELVPKRIALSNPEAIAAAIAPSMNGFAAVLAPAISFLSWSQDLILKATGISAARESQVSQEEIKQLVEEGAASGAIESVERDIVNRVFSLGEKKVSEVMTPSVQIIWLDVDATYEENISLIQAHRRMRYPVCKGESGPIGVVRLEDLRIDEDSRSNEQLFQNMSQPVYIPRTASVLRALSLLQSENMFMGFIIDEYGEVNGTLSLQEIFWAIVGDISPHAVMQNPAITEREDGSYLIDGVVSAEEVRQLLGLRRLPGDERGEVTTLAGVMFERFGRLPKEGDYFAWNGYRFEVVDMDGPRIDKVMVVPAPNLAIGSALAAAGD